MLYGQPSEGPVDWFLNIEILAKRCKERGWKIDLHSHPNFAQIMIVLAGDGTMMLGQESVRFTSPCALIVPDNAIHGFHYELDTDGWVLTLADYCLQQTVNRLPQLGQLLSTPGVIPISDEFCSPDMLVKRIENIQRELTLRGTSYEVIIESDLVSILVELERASQNASKVLNSYSNKQRQIVTNFKALIEQYLFDNVKIPNYAEQLNLSAFQLRSACEAVEDKSPKEMLEERRLMEAKKDLIFTAKSVEQIGYRLGFSDPSYFTRFFKKMEGESPTKFRDQFKNSPKPMANDWGVRGEC